MGRRLGRTGIELSPIGLGCWQFSGGQGLGGFFWDAVPTSEAHAIVRASLEGGIDWFDTAELYGGGESERVLSAGLLAAGKKNGDVFVATKWWPFPRAAPSIAGTFSDRLRALDPFSVDLHQVHQPFSFSSVEAEMEAMAGLFHEKKIRAIGVSNFGGKAMRRAQAALEARGTALASNQVRYSLVDRRIEKNGVLDAAKELGVTIIAYSPLGQGILSGKFHADPSRIPGGPRKFFPAFRPAGLARTKPLVDALEEIAKAHETTAAQVSLA